MKINRRTYFATPLVLLFALAFSVVFSSHTNALSLSDVTNTLGNVLGLNNQNNEQAPAQPAQTAPPASQTQQATPAQDQQSQAAPQLGSTSAPATANRQQSPQMTANAPVEPVQAVTPATADTGAIVKQLAAAQTNRAIVPVTYASSRIGSDIRDELYAVASVIVVVGMALYGMTFVRSSRSIPAVQRRPLYIK